MTVRVRPAGAMLVGLLLLAAACARRPLAPTDGAGTCQALPAADASPPFLGPSCSGIVTAAGTTPAGEFTAASVDVDYHCGTVLVVMVDAAGQLRLTVSFPLHADAGALGERSATVVLERPPREMLVYTTGTVTLTMLDDPLPDPDAGRPYWGIVAGAFSVDAGCLAIVGTFRSQYCNYDNLCG